MVNFSCAGIDPDYGVSVHRLDLKSLDSEKIYFVTTKEDSLTNKVIENLRTSLEVKKEEREIYDLKIMIYSLPDTGRKACEDAAIGNGCVCVNVPASFVSIQGAVCLDLSDRVFMVASSRLHQKL